MRQIIIKFSLIAALVLIVDQCIKQIFLNGFRWDGQFFSLILTFNKGVAFSMFASLGEYLKFIQIALLGALCLYLLYQKELLKEHTSAFGLMIGAGVSNLLDRFTQGGVVDYVFWHKWFEFAVFNFADVMIDLAVVIILCQCFICKKVRKNG